MSAISAGIFFAFFLKTIKMKKIVLSFLAIAAFSVLGAQNLSERDKKFITLAAEGGLLEVQLGKHASQNGESAKVRDLGKMMASDHQKANEELMALAKRKNVTVPSNLSDKKQKDIKDLKEKKGRDFDEAYSKFMVKDHKEDIALFKEQAEKGDDADLKAWASKILPKLEHHKKMADDTCEALKK